MRFATDKTGILKLLQKNRQLIAYLICSLITTLGEMLLGWLILNWLPERIVTANTIPLVLGAVAHYYLTSKYAFALKHTAHTIGVYVATFLLGLAIQDAAIFVLYHRLLSSLPEISQYLLSKVISMALALAATYVIRAFLNAKLKAKDDENEDKAHK